MNHPFSAYARRQDPSSFRIGEVLGITVRVHWMWFLVPLFLLSLGLGAFQVGALILATFGSVFLHELGHSLAARHFGLRVLDITFWPLGGMARMSEMPEDPKVEGVVAIAGPLVNFALVALTLPLMIALSAAGMGGAAGLAWGFITINLMLGVFNLIPAFPMDGGRVLRAFLARKHDWVRATEMAVKTGRVMAALMVGVFLFKGMALCSLPLIAAFIWYAGTRELWAVRMRHGLSPFGGASVNPFEGFAGARDEAWAEAEAHEREPEPPFEPGPRTTRARRPGQGFSEEELRELERFRGRLRRPGD